MEIKSMNANKEYQDSRIVRDRVSVIVPVYNGAAFLKRCIQCVQSQTYPNIELILVDDGSTDESASLCQTFTQEMNHVYIFTQTNRGPAAARNTGLRNASGEFVFFLDADDYLSADALAVLHDAQKRHDADLVLGGFNKQSSSGNVRQKTISFAPDAPVFDGAEKTLGRSEMIDFVHHFLKYPSNHLVSYCWGRLYRMQLIREKALHADESMRLFEDYIFNLDYMALVDEMVFINKPIYTYVMHNEHISASMAPLNGDQLAHDMHIFRNRTRQFLTSVDGCKGDSGSMENTIGHALVHYVIIFLVRSCWQLNATNWNLIRSQICKLLQADILQESLKSYRPLPGYSRLVPLLMRFRVVDLLMWICRYKAYIRYGRPNTCLTKQG